VANRFILFSFFTGSLIEVLFAVVLWVAEVSANKSTAALNMRLSPTPGLVTGLVFHIIGLSRGIRSCFGVFVLVYRLVPFLRER
jgi:hypothetical protein